MAEFDKAESCKGCPDRCVSPNCHTKCEYYLARVRKKKKENQNRREFMKSYQERMAVNYKTVAFHRG